MYYDFGLKVHHLPDFMHDLHACCVLHLNLKFSCLLKMKAYPLFNSQILLVGSANIFCNPIFIFLFSASRLIGETNNVGRALSLSLNPL